MFPPFLQNGSFERKAQRANGARGDRGPNERCTGFNPSGVVI